MALTAAQQEQLGQCFLFESVPPHAMGEVTADLIAERCKAGEIIYSRRAFRRAVGVVLEGRLTALKGKDLVLNTLGPGQCFGVAALFCPEEDYVTTVKAKTPGTLVFLPDRWLEELFRAYPETAVAYIKFLSQRICFLNRKIDSFTAPSVQEALYRHFLTVEKGGVVEIVGGYSQLARALNIGRASLYRALEELEGDERIRREGKRIVLLEDRAAGGL